MGGGLGGDLQVGKARPGPRSHRALPGHPAEVAFPREPPYLGSGHLSVAVVGRGGGGGGGRDPSVVGC